MFISTRSSKLFKLDLLLILLLNILLLSYAQVLPLELLFPTLLISLDLPVQSTLLNSLTEVVEIWLTWPRRETTSSLSSETPESLLNTDSSSVWSMSSSLMSPNPIKPELWVWTANISSRTVDISSSPLKLAVSTVPTPPLSSSKLKYRNLEKKDSSQNNNLLSSLIPEITLWSLEASERIEQPQV